MPFEIPALVPAVLAGVVLLVSLLPLGGCRRCLRERRHFAAAHRLLWFAVLLILGSTLVLFSMSLRGYRRLLQEAPVATVNVRQLAPQHFAVRLDLADGSHDSVELKGDEWQLDARVIKWTPRAVQLGAEPLYRVERLSGRYRDLAQAQTTLPSVAAVGEESALDLWNLKKSFPAYLPFVDADYGSAAYLPLLDGASYRVTLAPAGGLVARPADAATAARLKAAGW
jgi:hypothetical protein